MFGRQTESCSAVVRNTACGETGNDSGLQAEAVNLEAPGGRSGPAVPVIGGSALEALASGAAPGLLTD